MTRSTTQRHETGIRNGNEKKNEFIYDAANPTASYGVIISKIHEFTNDATNLTASYEVDVPEYTNLTVILSTALHHKVQNWNVFILYA